MYGLQLAHRTSFSDSTHNHYVLHQVLEYIGSIWIYLVLTQNMLHLLLTQQQWQMKVFKDSRSSKCNNSGGDWNPACGPNQTVDP